LRSLAENTLTCWQHSILDFLSCMGIDDIQKTSGNTMAITMTEDWAREVDALATREFGEHNATLNDLRVAAEPVPPQIRERYQVSRLLRELTRELPLVHAARILAQENANYHLENSNRNLSADFLEVIYRMAAGALPTVDEFFMASDMGALSLDAIGLKLSKASLAWSIERLRRDPRLLDYISLAVPRGFERPGAVAADAMVEIFNAAGVRLVEFDANGEGGFEVRPPRVTDRSARGRLAAALALAPPGRRDHAGRAARARSRRARALDPARERRRHDGDPCRAARGRGDRWLRLPRARVARACQSLEHLAGCRVGGFPHRARRGQQRARDDVVGRRRADPPRERRRLEVGEYAGGERPFRHPGCRPAPCARRRDQDQPGCQARQGRTALGRQGHADGESRAAHSGRH
jgi:hypothetical protein